VKSSLQYPGLSYHCELRISRGTNVSLSVYPNNRIVIRHPKRVSKEFILKFLEERRDWVKTQYEKNQLNNPKKTLFNEGDKLPIFGIERKVLHSKVEKSQITPLNLIINVKGLRSDSGRNNRARKFLKEALLSKSKPLVDQYIKEVGTKKYSLRIRSMRSLWGSCSPNNQITLNLALIFCPDFVLHYVIIHEVSHTKEHNHSKRFWNVLAKIEPNYEKAENWIKVNGKKVLCYLF
jgi:predicted metal-dependent hydrolase